MQLTPEQAQYFDNFEQLFLTEGWKTFVEEMKKNRQDLFDSALYMNHHDSFLIGKGRVQTFDQVIGFEKMIENIKLAVDEADEKDE